MEPIKPRLTLNLAMFFLVAHRLVFAQWEQIPQPQTDPIPPWCQSGFTWAIGSNSTFYSHFNVICDPDYHYFQLFRTTNDGINWTLKYNGGGWESFEALNDWYFLSADTGYILRNWEGGGSEFLERTYNGLTSRVSCYDCNYPVWNINIFSMIDFENVLVVTKLLGQYYFKKVKNDSCNLVQTLPDSYNSVFFRFIQFTDHDYFLGGHHGDSTLVIKSSDGGYTWATTFHKPGQIMDMEFLSDSIGFMVGNYGRIYKTENAGLNWLLLESNTTHTLRSIDYLNESIWITAGDAGILLLTYDAGNTWHKRVPPTYGSISEVRFPEKDEIIVVRGEELWKAHIDNLVSIPVINEKSLLINIFPNPAKDEITISQFQQSCNGQIFIYNPDRKKILERQIRSSETLIDIRHLPNGVYFVKLQDESDSAVGKFVKQ